MSDVDSGRSIASDVAVYSGVMDCVYSRIVWGPQCGIREMMGMELTEGMDIFGFVWSMDVLLYCG